MIGTLLSNRYKVLDELIPDPLIKLYTAQDVQQNTPILLSTLTPLVLRRPTEAILRFKRATDHIARLTHPNILKVNFLGESDNQTFIVQEYFDSQPLSKFVNQPWDIDRAVDLVIQIAEGLNLAHEQNILHETIRPQNILLSQAQPNVVKLYNFGQAILQDISSISEPNEIISTFGYLSPEASGIIRRPVDARSDIYSLGILFYQMATGTLPYQARDVATLIHQHIAQKPVVPSRMNVSIALVIDKIIMRLIAKDPQDRYQTLGALIADLKEYQRQRQEGKIGIDFEIARTDRLKQLIFTTKLIGRDAELSQLESFLEQTKQGKGTLCLIFGEPGIGKSRLIDELRGYVHSLNGIFCGGKCYQYEFRVPYKVFSEAIDAYIDKIKRLPKVEQEEHAKRIKETLGELGAEVVKISPAICDLIGRPPELVSLDPEKEKFRFLVTVTNFVACLATAESPLLMFLDDLQWVDDGSILVLEKLAEKIPQCPMLLVINYRDNEVDSSHILAQLVRKFKAQNIPLCEMPVKAFGLQETTQIVSQVLLEREVAVAQIARELNERAKGNPFFTLELLRSLIDSRIVYLKDEHYIYDAEQLKNASLPTTIVEAVLKRIRDLSGISLQILSYASVIGREIQFSLLLELTRKSSDVVLNSLEEGIRNQILYRDLTGQENIFFMHDRIREAFYQKVPEKECIPLHRHIAEVLEKEYKDNTEPVLYELAHHFIRGKVDDKALRYSLPAAHKAKASYAHILAIELYLTAKGILKGSDRINSPEYIEVLESLGEVYRLAGKFNESLESLEECDSLIPRAEKLHRSQVLAKMGDTLFEKGDVERSSRVLEEALDTLGTHIPRSKIGVIFALFKEVSQQALHTVFHNILVKKAYQGTHRQMVIVLLLHRLAYSYYYSDNIKMFYLYLKGLNFLENKIGPCAELAHNYTDGPAVYSTTLLAWPARAFRDGRLGLKMAQDVQNKVREGCGYVYMSLILYLVNKTLEGSQQVQKGIDLLKGLGEYFELSLAYCIRNYTYCVISKVKEAAGTINQLINITRETKNLQNLGWALIEQGRTLCLIGEVDEHTIEGLEESRELLNKTRDKMTEQYVLSFLGFTYMRMGQFDKAVEQIKTVPALYRRYGIGCFFIDMFPIGAEIYFAKITNTPDLEKKQKEVYLKKAAWFCKQAMFWGKRYPVFLGWAFQVNGTYNGLKGDKNKALQLWQEGIAFLRENTQDKYRSAYLLLEEAQFLLRDNPKDKKAYENLLEARDLFSNLGCKLDLETANKLLESIAPEGVTMDSRQVLTQKRHLDSLLSVTQAIGSIFIIEDLLSRILDYGLKVTGAERGFLLLFAENKKDLELKVSRGLEKEFAALPFAYENYRISLELINEVRKNKEALIVEPVAIDKENKIKDELNGYQVRQAIAVPLQTRDKPLGILYMDNRLAGGMFGKDELELMKSFAVQASVSIENAYLVANMVEQERIKQELELGRKIQIALLPKRSPDIEGLKVVGLTSPAKEIGGDYFDFVPLADNHLAIAIGDVSGKGVAAGLLMAMAKTAIRVLSQDESSPKQVLLRTNNIIYQDIEGEKFMTMLYLIWDPQSRTLKYSSAGHEHLIVYRAAEQKVEKIMSGGFMLGMFADISEFLENRQIALNVHDKLILYTDGVTEARDINENSFTMERLIDLVAVRGAQPADQLLHTIKDTVYAFIGTREQYDDITLVVMEAT